MKKNMTCLLLILFFGCFGQHDTTFFDKSWNICKRSSAEYYRVIKPKGAAFMLTDYYMSNIPQMEALCSRVDSIVKNGPYTFYDRQGRVIMQGMYTNNRETGACKHTDYFNNGVISGSGFMKNSLFDSTLTHYYRTGAVYSIRTYTKDTLNGLQTYFREDGSVSTTSNYLKGKLNGWYIEYRKNGNKHFEEEYKNGKSTGNKKLYFASGQVQGDFYWTERNVNGYKIWYYENGEIQSQVTFENGKRKKIVRSGRVVE